MIHHHVLILVMLVRILVIHIYIWCNALRILFIATSSVKASCFNRILSYLSVFY